ncbi:MAG: Ig-like domain-containing protein [Bacteroidaceae bacterium]|nr:Ig-like domain-containing protein [Bacteroidaceae bacterium]
MFKHSSHYLMPLLTAIICACASIGTPDGGEYDEEPPRVVTSLPLNQSTDAKGKKISIIFNEYIKLENPSEKVVVSPPQVEPPNIRADGKRVRITLYDTLQQNTTYTIDFADAIVDNNEGNPMGNYCFTFSTGSDIDTMEVSGYVLNAEDLEPIKGIHVGLFAVNDSGCVPDSIFRLRAMERVARTNSSGRFVVKGVARNRRYRAFALKDMDGDFRFSQKSEMLAAGTDLFEVTCAPDIRLDTIWRDSTHYDSIRPVHYTHFRPDDIVLRAFLEDGQDRHLLKTQRDEPDRFTVYFTAPSDSLPRIQGLNFEGDGGFIAEPSAKGDTIAYWIPDTIIGYSDTLRFVYSYLDSDTLHQLYWKDDTLELVPKTTRAKQLANLQKQINDWEKDYKKRKKKNKNLPPEENPHLHTYLTADWKPSGSIDPNQNPILTLSEPVSTPPDSSAVHFFTKVDTLWVEAPFEFKPVEGKIRQFQLIAEWDFANSYRIEIDSAAITGVMGHHNRAIKQDFRVKKEEEYGTLFIQLHVPDTGYIVQLLNNSDKPVATAKADSLGEADFFFIKPGSYYMRCLHDRNGDGVFTTGDYDAGIPPEEVYYFPQPIIVKAQWDVRQEWDVLGIPLHTQKPLRITKQKPDKEKSVRRRNQERSAEMRRASRK